MEESIVPTRCETTKEAFEIRFRKDGSATDGSSAWHAVEAVELADGGDAEGAADERRITGDFVFDPGYEGCPHCDQQSFFHCADCDNLSCWDGQTETVICPWCYSEIRLTQGIDELGAVDDSGGQGGGDPGVQQSGSDSGIQRSGGDSSIRRN